MAIILLYVFSPVNGLSGISGMHYTIYIAETSDCAAVRANIAGDLRNSYVTHGPKAGEECKICRATQVRRLREADTRRRKQRNAYKEIFTSLLTIKRVLYSTLCQESKCLSVLLPVFPL